LIGSSLLDAGRPRLIFAEAGERGGGFGLEGGEQRRVRVEDGPCEGFLVEGEAGDGRAESDGHVEDTAVLVRGRGRGVLERHRGHRQVATRQSAREHGESCRRAFNGMPRFRVEEIVHVVRNPEARYGRRRAGPPGGRTPLVRRFV